MDADRFDPMTRALAATRSRRGVLRIAATTALGTLVGVSQRHGTSAADPRRPFPQQLSYPGATHVGHRSRSRQNDDVRAAYDRWKKRYLVHAGTKGRRPLYRVAFGKPGTANHGRTVSEGQGYGMLIVPLMAGHDPKAQTIFDGLWRFARSHKSVIDQRLMAWKWPGANDSAFDGDCDIAYGLLLAHAQWGSGGTVDYRAAAATVLAGVLDSTIGPDSHLPLLGDWVDVAGEKYNQYTPRTSDVMPGHFRAFRRVSDASAWQKVLDATQTLVTRLHDDHAAGTGLLPDFADATGGAPKPAQPNFLGGEHDGAYSYNAVRDPWRLGVDALLHGDATSRAQTRRIAVWIEAETGGDPHQISAGYALDGTPLPGSNYFTTVFAAPFGVAAMTTDDQQQWLNAIYDAVRNRQEDYYEDTVTLLCLLVMTGNAWGPAV